MVIRTPETTLVKGRKREVFTYKVAMPEYELLPLPVKAQKAAAPAQKAAAPAPLPMPLPAFPVYAQTPKQLASDELDEYIDSLPLGKARKLYAKLKAIFG